jgi:DNA-directed RNA polymerase subunit RPC12/RpoP
VELFSISCTTCQKRLSVRDRSVIGEILICPNCGSMVLVSPPEDWNPHMADEDCDTVDEIEPPELTEPIFRREQLDQPAHPPPLVRPPARPAAEPWEDVEDPFEQPPPIPETPVDSEVPVESEAGEPLAPPRYRTKVGFRPSFSGGVNGC